MRHPLKQVDVKLKLLLGYIKFNEYLFDNVKLPNFKESKKLPSFVTSSRKFPNYENYNYLQDKSQTGPSFFVWNFSAWSVSFWLRAALLKLGRIVHHQRIKIVNLLLILIRLSCEELGRFFDACQVMQWKMLVSMPVKLLQFDAIWIFEGKPETVFIYSLVSA